MPLPSCYFGWSLYHKPFPGFPNHRLYHPILQYLYRPPLLRLHDYLLLPCKCLLIFLLVFLQHWQHQWLFLFPLPYSPKYLVMFLLADPVLFPLRLFLPVFPPLLWFLLPFLYSRSYHPLLLFLPAPLLLYLFQRQLLFRWLNFPQKQLLSFPLRFLPLQ